MQSIERFDGDYGYLSNGYIEPDGSFVEREYQSCKTRDPEQRAQVSACAKPFGKGGAKQAGRRVRLRDDWPIVRFQVMAYFVARKFADHETLRLRLRDTGHALLVEGNDWHDNEWGDCRCANRDGRHPDCLTPGLNWLGQILMVVRAVV